MSCDQVERVHALADGELAPDEAAATRAHLAGCAECSAELAEVMQLEAMLAPVARAVRLEQAKVTPLRRRRFRGAIAGAAAAVAASVAIYGVVRLRGAGPRGEGEEGGEAGGAQQVAMALPAHRTWETRLSWQGAAGHRPYHVARSAEGERSAIPLGALAQLERRGDVHGVGVLAMLNGDHRQAQAFLERAAASAAVIADRSALALAEGDAERALELADAALAMQPGHPAATWNRALALRELGLPRASAAAFRQVASGGEAGWADEASARAAALEREADERGGLTERVLAAGPTLAAQPEALAVHDAQALPGLSRLFVYDALRAATPAQLPKLAPLVAAVEGAGGGDAAADAGAAVGEDPDGLAVEGAVAGFARRAAAISAAHPELAATYAEILAGRPPTGQARPKYLAALRAAGADELLIGALIRLSPSGRVVAAEELPELARLAAASPDPWMKLLGAEQRAQVALASEQLPEAEAILLRARARCQAGGAAAPAFRCIKLGLLLGEVYVRWPRVAEARAELLRTWKLARAEREWLSERQLLEAMAGLSVISDDATGGELPLARAYTEELVLRQPGQCAPKVWAHNLIGLMLLNQLRVDDARRELAAAPPCDQPVSADDAVQGIFARVHLLREAAAPAAGDEVRALRAEIAAVRAAPSTPPAQRAFLDHAEGRLLIDGAEAAAGEALLRKAIAAAKELPTVDATARRAAAFSASVLALAAARRGDAEAAMRALADEHGVELPTRCALGLAVEDKRRLVVVRGADGAWTLRYDETRTSPVDDPRTLVPAALADALAACPVVDVLARPPLHGVSRLLPDAIAWRYRSARKAPLPAGASGAASASSSTGGASLRPSVIVGDVEPPAALGLPRLATWQTRAGAREQLLFGAAATPERVLSAIADAGEVVIHAHGVGGRGASGDSDASFLALSADTSGRYALTAASVRAATLRGNPLVVLAACRASQGAPILHEPWSLPAAFVLAGARAVVASTAPIPDREASEFFDGVRAAVASGASVAAALRDARVRWLGAGRADWVRDVLVFE